MVRNRHKPQKPVVNSQSVQNFVPKKTTMIIQLDEDLKKRFQVYCKENDFSCSQVLRKLMLTQVENFESKNNPFRGR